MLETSETDRWDLAVRNLAEMTDGLADELLRLLTESRHWESGHRLLSEAVRDLVWALGATGRLDGAMVYDECGEPGEEIVRVYLDRMEELWVETKPSGGCYLSELANTCIRGGFVGLPGTKRYGEQAIVELARARCPLQADLAME